MALALPLNSKTQLERVSKDKPSSLLRLAVGDEGKKFCRFDTRFANAADESKNVSADRVFSDKSGKKRSSLFRTFKG